MFLDYFPLYVLITPTYDNNFREKRIIGSKFFGVLGLVSRESDIFIKR